MNKCPYCAAGNVPVKMKRNYIHTINYRNFVCTEKGFHAEPGDWSGHSPIDWIPRRIRRQLKLSLTEPTKIQ